jgi:hypothetical protein
MRKKLEVVDADDGNFYMAFKDFVKYFDSVHIGITKKFIQAKK